MAVSGSLAFLFGFKPYYNWNTFNTLNESIPPAYVKRVGVLNLIITGIPSILLLGATPHGYDAVLNLIITGIPSILIK